MGYGVTPSGSNGKAPDNGLTAKGSKRKYFDRPMSVNKFLVFTNFKGFNNVIYTLHIEASAI